MPTVLCRIHTTSTLKVSLISATSDYARVSTRSASCNFLDSFFSFFIINSHGRFLIGLLIYFLSLSCGVVSLSIPFHRSPPSAPPPVTPDSSQSSLPGESPLASPHPSRPCCRPKPRNHQAKELRTPPTSSISLCLSSRGRSLIIRTYHKVPTMPTYPRSRQARPRPLCSEREQRR